MFTSDAIRVFVSARQARGLSAGTIRWYLGILERFSAQFVTLPDTPESIESFLSKYHLKDERRHGYYRAVRALYRFLKKRFDIPNPVEKIDPPIRIKKEFAFLMPEQIYRLMSYPHPPIVRSILMFLIDTGARIGEVSGITKDDIQSSPWGYLVKITGKTGTRSVPIREETHTALMATLPFKYTNWWLRVLVSRAFKAASVPGSSKTLRHTFGTLWDGDLDVLQRIMGHSRISTTEIYRHLYFKRLSEQHHKYSPLQFAIFDRPRML